jgi:hypothetical protein
MVSGVHATMTQITAKRYPPAPSLDEHHFTTDTGIEFHCVLPRGAIPKRVNSECTLYFGNAPPLAYQARMRYSVVGADRSIPGVCALILSCSGLLATLQAREELIDGMIWMMEDYARHEMDLDIWIC